MLNFYSKLVTMIIVQMALGANTYNSCDTNSSDSRSLGISVDSEKGEMGNRTDLVNARAEHSNVQGNVSVNALHNITECSGRRVIHIQGLIHNGDSASTSPSSEVSDKQISVNKVPSIVFHSKHGSNVVVSSNGRTIEKKNSTVNDKGMALTNRTLENDELFEVRLDRRGGRNNYSFGFGVSTKIPDDIENLVHISHTQHAWMYHNRAIYKKYSEQKTYGQNLNSLPVGTRFGVMKKSTGDIHFYVNEVDQGPAISGVVEPVYGAVELFYDAEKVTILKP